jgi:2-methylcitrate dehydratase PrpD
MKTATSTTARLCEWVCDTGYSDLKEEVRKEAPTILYDTIGGMIACSTLPTCQPVVDMIQAMGGNKQCSIVGHPIKTTVTYAALANGTIGHGDEVDATGQRGTGHFAAVTVPTALTVGQYAKVSGKELLRALVLGSEVSARTVSIWAEVFESVRRHFAESVGSIFGSAVVAGVLLKLNAKQMENAIALAASQASGLNAIHHDPTHQSKSFQRGNACHGGVVAALLASRDFHGAPDILTVEHGYFDAFMGYAGFGDRVTDDLGNTYLMRQIAYKRFPVGGPNQTPLYLFLQLLKQHKLTADKIDQVEVTMSRGAFLTVATDKHPSIHMRTILSLAAVFGELNFRHIHESQYYEDPRVEAFKERIKLLPEASIGSMGKRLEVKVTVRTRSGEMLSQELRYPLMTKEELQDKFRFLAGLRLSKDKVLDLENKLKNIEAVDDVSSLISELEIEKDALQT